MGYYIYLNEHEFTVKAEHFAEVIERWKKFEAEGGQAPYSSIFDRFPTEKDQSEPPINELFGNIGFEVIFEPDEAISIDGWEGKYWSQREYLMAISDLAEPGWYLDWTGEDDDRWRETAEGVVSGETVFVRPHLKARLDELSTLLAAYDDSPLARDGELTEQVMREIVAAGPLVEAVRALIKDLS